MESGGFYLVTTILLRFGSAPTLLLYTLLASLRRFQVFPFDLALAGLGSTLKIASPLLPLQCQERDFAEKKEQASEGDMHREPLP